MSCSGARRRQPVWPWSRSRSQRQALAKAALEEAETVAFGDLFLADIRAYREERLSRVGMEAIFPLWGRDTNALAREFIDAGFDAILVCVDPRRLDPSFAGSKDRVLGSAFASPTG